MQTAKTDQTVRMRRLIRVYAGTHAILNETALVAQFDARPTGEHSLPSADSRKAVVSFCRKNLRNTG